MHAIVYAQAHGVKRKMSTSTKIIVAANRAVHYADKQAHFDSRPPKHSLYDTGYTVFDKAHRTGHGAENR